MLNSFVSSLPRSGDRILRDLYSHAKFSNFYVCFCAIVNEIHDKNTHDACPRNRFPPDNFHGDSIYSILIRETVACVGKLTLEFWRIGNDRFLNFQIPETSRAVVTRVGLCKFKPATSAHELCVLSQKKKNSKICTV